MIPKKIYIRELDIDIFNEEAEVTRAWVANKPCTGRREYTDLSQVWHPAEEEPESGKYILGEYPRGVYNTYLVGFIKSKWIYYVNIFGLIRWAYIDDLLPRGDEQ